MSVLPWDDLPLHQAPLTFDQAVSSDVHFNDGYWFSTYTDGFYLTSGIRLHPNMNVVDGFAGFCVEGEQRTARFSAPLRPVHSPQVGPLRLTIVEPMKSLRLTLDESPSGLRFDLTFEAVSRPCLETPSQHLKHGHVINDVLRYIQVCRTHGEIEYDGLTRAVESWHAMRDHSWGIRASMGPRTRHGGLESTAHDEDRRAFRIWVPFEVAGHAGFFHTHEDVDGEPLDFEGRLYFDDGSEVELVAVEHDLEYHPETTNVRRGRFTLIDENDVRYDYRVEPSGPPADVQGLGYYRGWHDQESAGMYRGNELVVESDRYAVDPSGPPATLDHVPDHRRVGPTEFPSRLVGPDGAEGMAHFEHYILGAYKPYGFL